MRIFTFIILLLLSLDSAVGQTMPFPQEINYPNGFKATTFTSQDALSAYTRWKSLFLVQCTNYYRVEAGSGQSLSECTGYGMLLTASLSYVTTFLKADAVSSEGRFML